jgi:glycosyltransferase involved in cell wall biosynthesis
VTLGQTGGARVILNLAEILVARGHEVTIIIDRNKINYETPKGVVVKYLSVLGLRDVKGFKAESRIESVGFSLTDVEKVIKPKIKMFSLCFKWLKYLFKLITVYPIKYCWVRKFLREDPPDLVASHNMYQEFEHIWFYKGYNFYLVIHNSPNEVFKERNIFSLMPVNNYLKGIKTIAVSEDASLELSALYGDVIGERVTIYNPFDFDLIRSKAGMPLNESLPENYFVVIAALAPRKRIDRLIKSIQRIDEDVELVVLGEGVEESNLKKLAGELGVADRVHFKGFCENPYAYLQNSKGLLLSSDSEGLPTVLIESLICGVPVVSTNCPTGPREILQGDLSQFLVDLGDEEGIVESFSVKMSEVIKSSFIVSPDNIDRFSKTSVATQWEYLARKQH